MAKSIFFDVNILGKDKSPVFHIKTLGNLFL